MEGVDHTVCVMASTLYEGRVARPYSFPLDLVPDKSSDTREIIHVIHLAAPSSQWVPHPSHSEGWEAAMPAPNPSFFP